MNIFRAIMFTVHVLVFFLLLGLATSEENIYVDYESNPDHPFPAIRRGKSTFILFMLYCKVVSRVKNTFEGFKMREIVCRTVLLITIFKKVFSKEQYTL